jgi:hypothetical protein
MRIALLLFEALWLNVIVPGHRRGIVPLPGEACWSCAAQASTTRACCTDPLPRKHAPLPGDPAEHCAICHFAAMLMAPPAIGFELPPLGLLKRVDVPVAGDVYVAAPLIFYDRRGPPWADSFLI